MKCSCEYKDYRGYQCKRNVSGYVHIFLIDRIVLANGHISEKLSYESRYLAVCSKHMKVLKTGVIYEVISYGDYVVGKIMQS
jgi:hypothetical protein